MGWFDDRRVELLDGEIYERPVPRRSHVLARDVTTTALRATFGRGYGRFWKGMGKW
jgi:hypothetical protein